MQHHSREERSEENLHPRTPAWLTRAVLVLGGLFLLIWGASPALAAEGAGADVFKWRPFLAPFHAVVLHYPIGFLTVAVVLEIYRMLRPGEEVLRIIRLIVWLSLITGLAAAGLGILRAGSGEYDGAALSRHRALGLTIPVAMALTLWLLSRAFRGGENRLLRNLYRAALGTTFALLIAAGHFGGNLTHGSRYLTENAPGFLREFMEDFEGEPVAAADSGGAGPDRAFATLVAPVFEKKCVSCHGPEKQKGGLRLDDPALAVKAGKSGRPAVVPGKPLESEVVARILLPGSHEDAMPPDGKQPLDAEEILAVIRWVQQSAAAAAAGLATNAAGAGN
jgi:mono/diheme cytochrome c family protein/uncharacterized membrane protein